MSIKNPIQAGDGDPRHGTSNGYTNHLCRCQACRGAFANRWLSWQRRQRLPRNDPRHGTANGYRNHGCRCRACTDAATADRRRWPKY